MTNNFIRTKPIISTLLSLVFLFSLNAFSSEFKYRPLKDFKTLSEYKSVGDFEKVYKDYIQTCLDKTYGGSAGINCLIDLEIWDRELNIYYKKLVKILTKSEREQLKQSQKIWLQSRDASLGLAHTLVGRIYDGKEGTMWSLISAGDVTELHAPMIKERALLLRSYYKRLVESSE